MQDKSPYRRALYLFPIPVLLLCMGLGAGYAGERTIPESERVSFGGAVLTRDGRWFDVQEFLSPLRDTYICGGHGERRLRVKASELRAISLLDPGCPYGLYLHGVSRGGRMRLTFLSGETLELREADFSPRNLEEMGIRYRFQNPASGTLDTGQISPLQVAEIVLTRR